MPDSSLDMLRQSAEMVAPRLLGCELRMKTKDGLLVGRIVETEAYDQSDVASHSYRGETPRTKVMFGEPGHLYVYFTYGMHYCCNIVTGEKGHGSAVLLRALEPIDGYEIMSAKRNGRQVTDLTNGPAKLCQAFGIDKVWNGHYLGEPPLSIVIKPPIDQEEIVQTTRIGISRGQDVPWRFYIRDNKFVSKL